MATVKIPREETEFVTPEGILTFMALYPGEHVESFSNRAYKVEWIGDIPANHPMIKCARRVAGEFDKNPERCIFGPTGRLQKQEEKLNRKQYDHAVGKYIIDFSKVMSLKSLKLNDLDLTNPVHRQRYDAALDEGAPCAHRYVRTDSDGAILQEDLQRIQVLNQERLLKGLPAYDPAQYGRILLRVPPAELWSGCYGHVSGYFYWNTNGKPPTLGIGLNNVLMTRQGERLIAVSSPDQAFAAFAPSAELAPQKPVEEQDWSTLLRR